MKEEHLETLNLIPETFQLRLPTEAEWGKAAQGLRGRLYAWGDVWNRERAKTSDSNTRRTTPVGIYPNGATSEKVYDLIGNVWEWTSSKSPSYSYQNDECENPEWEDLRVVRGGSFYDISWFARCAFRLDYNPHDSVGLLNMRVVLSPIRL